MRTAAKPKIETKLKLRCANKAQSVEHYEEDGLRFVTRRTWDLPSINISCLSAVVPCHLSATISKSCVGTSLETPSLLILAVDLM